MSDANKVGHYFAVPYLHYDLTSCFVLADKGLPKGYILGTTNTDQYTMWLNDKWLKQITPLYPKEAEPVDGFDAFLNTMIHTKASVDERLKGYDAHFHIDLLEPYQNAGWGKKLIHCFLEQCQKQIVNKLCLVVSRTNVKALGFYEHVGFKVIFKDENVFGIGLEVNECLKSMGRVQ